MKNVVTTLDLQSINEPVACTVKVNFNFSLEGKELVKETETYVSNVEYYPGLCIFEIDTDEGIACLSPSDHTGKVFHRTNNLIGQVKTEYKDTGDVQYTLIYGECIIKGDTKEVDVYLVKENKVTLKVRSCGKMSIVANKKLITDARHLRESLYLMCDRFNLNISVADYYLSRSPKIKSTNWDTNLMSFYYLYTFNNPKVTVYRKVAKNDIKGATATLLWHPQASKAVVRKIRDLLDLGTHGISDKLKLARDEISTIKLRDVQGFNNFSLALLNNFDNVRNPDSAVYLGAVFPKICKSLLVNKDSSLVEDTFRAYQLLEPNDIYPQDYDIISFRELHDVLAQRLTELENNKTGIVRLPTLNELPIFSKDGYTIKSVNAHDLPSLGKAMSICVGMYKKPCWLGTVNISTVYNSDNKPLACLEWYYGQECGKPYLVQAKLFANEMVCKDNHIHDIVSQWCDENGITVFARDMGDSYEGGDASLPPKPKALPERQALIQSQQPQHDGAYQPPRDGAYQPPRDEFQFF